MSRTDKTKPYRVKVAEHHPVEVHNHERGICDLPDDPREHKWTGCHWSDENLTHSNCCRPGCNCWSCTQGYAGKWKRRRDRYAGKKQIRAGETWDIAPRYPAKKDTTRWCKGHKGRQHRLVVRWSNWAAYMRERGRTCYEQARVNDGWFGGGWRCYHEVGCDVCGKIIQSTAPKRDCPVYVALRSKS